MPHEYEKKIVVTKEELVPDFFPTEKALYQKLWRDQEKTYGIKRADRGGGLNRRLLVDFDTLPKDWRDVIGDPRHLDSGMEKYYREDSEAVTFFARKKVGKKGTLPTSVQDEYIVNASVIRAALLYKAERRSEMISRLKTSKGIDKLMSEDINGFNRVLKTKYGVIHTLPSNYLSLKRVIDQFEKEGYESLISGKYNNQNAGRKTDAVKKLLERMFTTGVKPTPIEVARKYDAFLDGYVELIDPDTGELFNPKEFRKLSQRAITQFLASWESKVVTYQMRAGDRQKYMSEFESFVSTGHPKWAGSILSIDDRQPPFEYAKGKRMWFYNGIDLGSEAFTCWVWGTGKADIIEDFYREMVRNYTEWGISIPAELECESNLNASYRDTLLREGNMFQYVRIEANNARGKRIEMYYRQLRYAIEKEEEGWLGRPFALSEANQARPDGKIIPYEQLVRKCLKHIQTWNNMPHSIYKHKTRWEVFMERQNPDLRPTNWHGILPWLGEKTSKTCRAGNISWRNKSFLLLAENGQIQTGQALIDLMSVVEGQKLDIYWMDGHEGQLLKALAYLNGRYVCELLPKPIVNRARIEQTQEDRKAMEMLSRYNETIRGYVTRRKNEIGKIIIVDNRKKTLNDKFQIRDLAQDMHLMVYNDEPEDDDLVVDVETTFEQPSKRVQTAYELPSMSDSFIK